MCVLGAAQVVRGVLAFWKGIPSPLKKYHFMYKAHIKAILLVFGPNLSDKNVFK
jgi:hypothetical protein